jgi:hypothetical protein
MNREQMLLVKLIEECAEISKVATKALRFGMNSIQPSSGETNRKLLKEEHKDYMATLMLLQDETGVFFSMTNDEIRERKARIEEYFKVSQNLGIMDKEKEV